MINSWSTGDGIAGAQHGYKVILSDRKKSI